LTVKDYSISVQIDAPPEQVWPVMSDVERWHEWTPTVTRMASTAATERTVVPGAPPQIPQLPPLPPGVH